MIKPTDLEAFRADGAIRIPGVLNADETRELASQFTPFVEGRPGSRLRGGGPLAALLESNGALGRLATRLLGGSPKPVRAVIFDKSPQSNWSVAWHQDRTIAVKERVDVDGFGPWSRKDGVLHVTPPPAVFEHMTTLRLHLDDCPRDNAPLIAALGTHKLGRVAADQASTIAQSHRQLVCLAEAGDVWAYATPILHSSARSATPSRRRVLQVDYAAFDLAGGLEWLGLAPVER